VSDGLNNRDMAITPDGDAIYWSSNLRNFDVSVILVARRTADGWSEPEVAPFSREPGWRYLEPAISPDGERMFFVAAPAGSRDNDIWMMERDGGAWGAPQRLGEPVNTPLSETYPSVTRDGTLYFSRAEDGSNAEHIYRARFRDGGWLEPERLPAQVNSGKSQFNAFVAPDESFVIVPVWGREDSVGSVDYYAVFRDARDRWSEPVNLGPQVNTAGGQEYTPYVSPDGRYFFFMSNRSPAGPEAPSDGYTLERLRRLHARPENGSSDLYWMRAEFIEALRPDGF
jgi:DNA-binding beta-propeller fold protein YncE